MMHCCHSNNMHAAAAIGACICDYTNIIITGTCTCDCGLFKVKLQEKHQDKDIVKIIQDCMSLTFQDSGQPLPDSGDGWVGEYNYIH